MHQPIVKRYVGNPILTKNDIPYPVYTVHNAGMTKYNGKYYMLFRSHLNTGRSILGLAISDDGYHFKAEDKPFMVPATEGVFKTYEEWGVEDPRICLIGDEYFITYSCYSRHGVRIGLARTKDFKAVERVSFISQADMRNIVIFPEKINGRYARLDRPHTEEIPYSIWISYSPDLIHWGDSEIVIKPMKYYWDYLKVGPGATPFKTDKGWLSIIHGVRTTMDGAVYRLGCALHDLKDPANVLGVYEGWILEPEEIYEKTGYVHNVVFTSGAIPEDDGTVKIYWGGADTVMCVGTANINELVDLCLTKSRPALG